MAEESSKPNAHETFAQQHVEVLYSFTYTDDFGTFISIVQGEIYKLLNVDSNDWWEVCRLDDSTPFYVPKTYVQKVTGNVMESDPGDSSSSGNVDGSSQKPDDCSHVNATRDHDEGRDKADFQGVGPHAENLTDDQYCKEIKCNDIYANVEMETSVQSLQSEPNIHTGQHSTFTGRPANFIRAFSLNDGGDYANLEDFRQRAGIPSPSGPLSPGSPESDGGGEYANLADLNISPSPPLPDTCEYKKTLLDKWDVYLDPISNRIFYVDKSTNSRTWKPPRDKNVQFSSTSGSANSLQKENIGSLSPRQFRDSKAKSMFVNTDINPASIPPTIPSFPKSSTLPANIKAAAAESLENRLEIQQRALQASGMPQTQPQEPLAGILNKAKVVENGKRVTKKWSTSYVVLSGTNLIFYKDQKALQIKPGSPPAKFEFIVSLPTATVELNPKDFSSRKNVIKISFPENQVLIQHDDERKIMEWFTKLKLTLDEVGGPSEVTVETLPLPENEAGETKRKPSFKSKDKDTKHVRKPSEGGGLEKDKGFIRNVLVNFLMKRQTVTALKARGIYKDAVFGADLKQLCEREKQKVPLFLQKAIAAIENRGLHHDGLYRVGGNVSQIQKLRCAVDAGQNIDLDDAETWDVHVIAGALKLFFRELKEPVFTYSLFDKFVKALMMEKNADRLKGMKTTVNELPKCNYETMKLLFTHLTKLIENEKENRMNSYSVAVVFGPSLIWPEIEAANLATSIVYQSKVVEYVLVEYKNIFR